MWCLHCFFNSIICWSPGLVSVPSWVSLDALTDPQCKFTHNLCKNIVQNKTLREKSWSFLITWTVALPGRKEAWVIFMKSKSGIKYSNSYYVTINRQDDIVLYCVLVTKFILLVVKFVVEVVKFMLLVIKTVLLVVNFSFHWWHCCVLAIANAVALSFLNCWILYFF